MSNKYTGDLPSYWRENKVGGVYKERTTKVSDRDFPPLSVTKKGIVPQLDTVAKTNDNDNRKLVKKNDFVINSRSDRRGSCGISKYEGSVSLINTVLEPINNEKFYNNYYDWLFHTENFADEFYKWGHGIVDDLWTTRWLDMKNIEIPYPPLSEQKAIADFLDNKCAQIDEITKDLEEKNNKLEAYKSQVIYEAVTKGLNDDVEYVDSGVRWIKAIPQKWTIRRIRSLLACHESGDWGLNEEDGQTKKICIRIADFNYSSMDIDTSNLTVRGYNRINTNKILKEGDILLEKSGGGDKTPVGRNVYIGSSIASMNCIFTNFIELLRPSNNINSKYLSFAMKAIYSSFDMHFFFNQTTGLQNIDLYEYLRTFIPYPPLEEQKAIADFLDDKCSKIDEITKATREEIETLKKYKQSLIYEYVTGKKEVPNE